MRRQINHLHTDCRARPRTRLCLALLSLLPICSAHADFTLRVQTDLGGFNILMFENDAPVTVSNFMDYVNSGAYDGMFFHRYAESAGIPFVLQTGGYSFDPNQGTFFSGGVQQITSLGSIVNEFGHSNTRGTLAMAKLPGDPNSATSEWFINLADNSANLDTQNGGFTVFAQVQGDGMKVIDEIVSFGQVAKCVYFEPVPGSCGAFSDMPFRLQQNQFFFDNDTLFNVQSIGADADGDGAIDKDEIDGNSDSTPDSSQPNVASAPLIESPSDYLTVATPSASYPLSDFTVLGNTYRITRPESRTCVLNGIDLPYGLTSFRVNGLAPGGSIAVDVILPASATPASYYMYGPEWLGNGNYNAVERWYEALPFNGTIGSEISGNRVTLHLVDGGWGDADMSADGVITVAPGGGSIGVTPATLTDGDCDGVADSVENDPANNFGDGNNDGTPDAEQPGVASLPDLRNHYLTMQALTLQQDLENVRVSNGRFFLQRASVTSLSGLNLANGFIDFAISNVAPGGTAEVRLSLPAGSAPDRFYLLGQDSSTAPRRWLDFTSNAQTGDGTVSINGNEMTLRFVDGGRGDLDRTVNGVIYVAGAPAVVLSAGGGGGGGCSLAGSRRFPRQAGAWWLILAMLSCLRIYRHRIRLRCPPE